MGAIDPLGLAGVGHFPPGAAYTEAGRMIRARAATAWRSKNVAATAVLFGMSLRYLGDATYLEWQNNKNDECEDDNRSVSEILDDLTTTPIPPPDRCSIVYDQCLLECEGSLGGKPWDQAWGFRRCVQQCMYDNNCGGTNYR